MAGFGSRPQAFSASSCDSESSITSRFTILEATAEIACGRDAGDGTTATPSEGVRGSDIAVSGPGVSVPAPPSGLTDRDSRRGSPREVLRELRSSRGVPVDSAEVVVGRERPRVGVVLAQFSNSLTTNDCRSLTKFSYGPSRGLGEDVIVIRLSSSGSSVALF